MLTPSHMLPLGTQAPAFSLPDTDGNRVSLGPDDAKGYLVFFICNKFPYAEPCEMVEKHGEAVPLDVPERLRSGFRGAAAPARGAALGEGIRPDID